MAFKCSLCGGGTGCMHMEGALCRRLQALNVASLLAGLVEKGPQYKHLEQGDADDEHALGDGGPEQARLGLCCRVKVALSATNVR
jgi:hypothetical protein